MNFLKTLCLVLVISLPIQVLAQASGNVNHSRKKNANNTRYNPTDINIADEPDDSDVLVTINGLANVKADAYVAIFAISQVGTTTNEVNRLIDERIKQPINEIKRLSNVTTFVDMISFVPVYEYNVEKKVFSKKSYTEIPKGFQVKKNIHVKFSDPDQLNKLITILSKYEIYDLVKVDYFSSKLEETKKQLQAKAKVILDAKVKNYESILGHTLTGADISISDGFAVKLPIEMYETYQAYNSSSIQERKSYNVDNVDKNTTYYYQAISQKNFDFTINPVVLEPVVQVMYQIKVRYDKKKPSTEKTKNYMIITPNGDVKPLLLK